jgi:hypothetical protein
MSRRRQISLLVLVMALGCLTALRARAETVDVAKAAKVKAAYLLNFVRYTEWPDHAFSSPGHPIVLTVVGDCDLIDVLAEAIGRGGPVGGRPVALRRATLPRGELNSFYEGLLQSHLVYLCSVDRVQLVGILRRLRGADILTVSDLPHFAEHGGMLGFLLDQDRIVFEANPKALETTGVNVSAKVLKLARIVEPEGQ